MQDAQGEPGSAASVSHGAMRDYRKGCRCEECRKANSAYQAEQRRKRAEKTLAGATAVPHGRGGYANYGCRCDVCASAHSAFLSEAAASRKARVNDAPHGTKAGYKGWGCRCELCRLAANKTDRRPRETWEHGTLAGYINHRCRCDDCVSFGSAYKKAWMEAARERVSDAGLPDGVEHGSITGYTYGCRCEPCRNMDGERKAEWAAGEQAATLRSAVNYGKQWTGAELEIVVTRHDLTVTQLARMLGRSRSAVATARHRATADPKWIAVAGVGAAGERQEQSPQASPRVPK